MNITVNGKEYILEYTFEAAECHECIDAAMDIFGGMMTAKIDSKHSEEMQVRDFLMSLSDLPRMAMDMFYAGLLENHGTGPDGDGTITSRADARCLYKQFCKENPEDERATSYYALCTSIAEQMEKDGFFKRTGMEDILENMESLVKNKQKKQCGEMVCTQCVPSMLALEGNTLRSRFLKLEKTRNPPNDKSMMVIQNKKLKKLEKLWSCNYKSWKDSSGEQSVKKSYLIIKWRAALCGLLSFLLP